MKAELCQNCGGPLPKGYRTHCKKVACQKARERHHKAQLPAILETDISKQIRSLLFQVGGLPIKIVGAPYQRPGISDFLVCLDGKFVAIEVKRPKGRLSDGQEKFLHNVRAAGGIAFVAYSVDDVVRELGLDVKLYPMFARRGR